MQLSVVHGRRATSFRPDVMTPGYPSHHCGPNVTVWTCRRGENERPESVEVHLKISPVVEFGLK